MAFIFYVGSGNLYMRRTRTGHHIMRLIKRISEKIQRFQYFIEILIHLTKLELLCRPNHVIGAWLGRHRRYYILKILRRSPSDLCRYTNTSVKPAVIVLKNWPCLPMIRLPNVLNASVRMWINWCRPAASGPMGYHPDRVGLQHRPVNRPAEGSNIIPQVEE